MRRLLFIMGAMILSVMFAMGQNSSVYESDSVEPIVLTKAEKAQAMQAHKALEEKYNVKRGNRPAIDLTTVPKDIQIINKQKL